MRAFESALQQRVDFTHAADVRGGVLLPAAQAAVASLWCGFEIAEALHHLYYRTVQRAQRRLGAGIDGVQRGTSRCVLKPRQLRRPEDAELGGPAVVDQLDRRGVKPQVPFPPIALRHHQAALRA